MTYKKPPRKPPTPPPPSGISFADATARTVIRPSSYPHPFENALPLANPLQLLPQTISSFTDARQINRDGTVFRARSGTDEVVYILVPADELHKDADDRIGHTSEIIAKGASISLIAIDRISEGRAALIMHVRNHEIADDELVSHVLQVARSFIESDRLIGTIVAGYRITRLLGKGGMGSVYEGVHVQLDTPAAIKILDKNRSTEDLTARFKREAKTLATLDHPNIVRFMSYEKLADGSIALVMERINGQDLSDRIKKNVLNPEQLPAIFIPVFNALAYAHNQNVIHRDIKPANILIKEDEVVKIGDFGLAFSQDKVGPRDTATGLVAGTGPYMAPELALGAVPNAQTDVFALGVTIIETLTGTPNIDNLNSITHLPLKEVLFRAVDRELLPRTTTPKKRYKTITEFKEAFEAAYNSNLQLPLYPVGQTVSGRPSIPRAQSQGRVPISPRPQNSFGPPVIQFQSSQQVRPRPPSRVVKRPNFAIRVVKRVVNLAFIGALVTAGLYYGTPYAIKEGIITQSQVQRGKLLFERAKQTIVHFTEGSLKGKIKGESYTEDRSKLNLEIQTIPGSDFSKIIKSYEAIRVKFKRFLQTRSTRSNPLSLNSDTVTIVYAPADKIADESMKSSLYKGVFFDGTILYATPDWDETALTRAVAQALARGIQTSGALVDEFMK